MPRSLVATLAAPVLERLLVDRVLLLRNGAEPPIGQPLDALLWIEPPGDLPVGNLARALAPGGWLALAAIDTSNRFHAALAEATGHACDNMPFGRLAALVDTLESNGFSEVEVVRAAQELRVVPTQDWVLGNAATPALAATRPPERAALLRAVAARLKDLWHEDAFRVPVAVQCLYARKRRNTS